MKPVVLRHQWRKFSPNSRPLHDLSFFAACCWSRGGRAFVRVQRAGVLRAGAEIFAAISALANGPRRSPDDRSPLEFLAASYDGDGRVLEFSASASHRVADR